jgi:tol-pal system protein YbgF
MRFFPLLVLLIALLAAGCASTGEISQVRQDVTSVYSEQTSYIQKTDAQLARLEKNMKELQNTIGTPESGIRKQVVDLSVAGDNRDEKIRTILGRLDELESQMRAYWEEVKGELREMRKSQGGTPAASAATPEDLYKQAFDNFQKGAYKEAVAQFTEFIKKAPDSPLAQNAYYWLGESYMNMKAYEKAIVQFQEVVDKYPKSDKAARAMIRQAEGFAAIGDKKSSSTILKKVEELFPKTEEARLADRMLRGGALD